MTTPPPSDPVQRVDSAALRRFFAEARIEERAASGELTVEVSEGTERPARRERGEPPGTVSHIIVYTDQGGSVVALAHEYLRPDGSIGASGQRDPKLIRVGGRTYKQ